MTRWQIVICVGVALLIIIAACVRLAHERRGGATITEEIEWYTGIKLGR